MIPFQTRFLSFHRKLTLLATVVATGFLASCATSPEHLDLSGYQQAYDYSAKTICRAYEVSPVLVQQAFIGKYAKINGYVDNIETGSVIQDNLYVTIKVPVVKSPGKLISITTSNSSMHQLEYSNTRKSNHNAQVDPYAYFKVQYLGGFTNDIMNYQPNDPISVVAMLGEGYVNSFSCHIVASQGLLVTRLMQLEDLQTQPMVAKP